MTLSCSIINHDPYKNFHNNYNKCNRHSKRRIKYYENGTLYIKIGENIYEYPPKGGVIIFNNDKTKVLMVRNNYHPWVQCQKWGFPKGHCNQNEKYHTCAGRELKEETGIVLDVKSSSKYIVVNNSRYYVYVLNTNLVNDICPIDTNEINKVEFQPIDIIGSIKMNKEATVVLSKKIELAKNIAQPINL